MSIGQRLKEARLANDMTQIELADAVGITKGAIGNYETDVSSPKESILIKLMDVLHVDANYVYQDYIRIDAQISMDEKHLLDLYRNANEQAREDAVRTLESHQKKDSLPEAK